MESWASQLLDDFERARARYGLIGSDEGEGGIETCEEDEKSLTSQATATVRRAVRLRSVSSTPYRSGTSTRDSPSSWGGCGAKNCPRQERMQRDDSRSKPKPLSPDSGSSGDQLRHRKRSRSRHRDHGRPAHTNTFFLPPLLSPSELESVVSIRLGGLPPMRRRDRDRDGDPIARSPDSAAAVASSHRTANSNSPNPHGGHGNKTLRKMSSFLVCCPSDPFEEPPPPPDPTTAHAANWLATFNAAMRTPPAAGAGTGSVSKTPDSHTHAHTHNEKRYPERRSDILSQAVAQSLGLRALPPKQPGTHECEPDAGLDPFAPPIERRAAANSNNAAAPRSDNGNEKGGYNPKVPFPQQWFNQSEQSDTSDADDFQPWLSSFPSDHFFRALPKNASAESLSLDDDPQLVHWLDFIAADLPPDNNSDGNPAIGEPSPTAMDRVLQWRAEVRPPSESIE